MSRGGRGRRAQDQRWWREILSVAVVYAVYALVRNQSRSEPRADPAPAPTAVPAPPPAPAARRRRLRWWRELLYILAFYAVYSAVRNQFGSEAVTPAEAFANARDVIGLERAVGLYFEPVLQDVFVPGWHWFLRFWNIFYGSAHFVVTAGALIWLFRSRPERYPTWRNTLACTTALALIGFAAYPLMPPRLLTDCGPFGACRPSYDYVDTLRVVGGLWSFDTSTMQKISNQYAAMPSLHIGWAVWSALVLLQLVRRRWVRALAVTYPLVTLFAIVVTANHYWLDAVGGAAVLGGGYLLGAPLARRMWAARPGVLEPRLAPA